MKIGLWEFAIIGKWYYDKGYENGYSWWLYGCFHIRKWDSWEAKKEYFKW